ncbi:MAG: MarR family winged helix-turn-helix transcriptional regulator [Thermoleophilia bacterium]
MGAHSAMTRAFNAELQARCGITVTDFEVLRRLGTAEGGLMRRVDIATAVGLTPSGVTRLLDGLESAGLVRKEHCSSDARVTYAKITPEGTALLATALDTHLAGLDAVFAGLFSGDEVATLIDLLGRLPGAEEGVATCPGGE